MSIFLWVAVARAFEKYTVYLTPEEIYTIIKEWYPESVYEGNKIKIRRSFFYSRNLKILAGPMPALLTTSWAMSTGMWIIFILSLIIVPVGIIIATIHLYFNVSFTEDIIFRLKSMGHYPPPLTM
jgi:hypothetical protein